MREEMRLFAEIANVQSQRITYGDSLINLGYQVAFHALHGGTIIARPTRKIVHTVIHPPTGRESANQIGDQGKSRDDVRQFSHTPDFSRHRTHK